MRAVVDVLPAHRLTYALAVSLRDGVPAGMQWPDGDYRLHAAFFTGEDPADYVGEIEAFAPEATITHLASPVPGKRPWGEIVVQIPLALLEPTTQVLATTSAVELIDLFGPPTTFVDDSIWFLQTGIPDTGPIRAFDTTARAFAHGLTGAGEIGGIADTSFKHRLCHFLHSGTAGAVTTPVTFDPDVAPVPVLVSAAKNKVITYYRVHAGSQPPCDTFARHGTLTAGLMAGDDWNGLAILDDPFDPEEEPRSLAGFGVQHHDEGDGLAPGAKLVLLSFQQRHPDGISCVWHDDLSTASFQYDLNEQAWATAPPGRLGARVHSDSYGASPVPSTEYTYYENVLDGFQWGHRDYLSVRAAGNLDTIRMPPEDPAPDTLRTPAHFKSGLSVGASVHASDPTADGPGEDLANYSVHGPGAGRRVKPDLVAPGGGTGGQPIVRGPGHPEDAPPLGACEASAVGSGTSFAAPAIAGLALQVRQYFRQGFYPAGFACGVAEDGFNPTSALTKAVLINSTRSLLGASTADDPTGGARQARPTFGQGWGRPVLDDSLYFPGDPGAGGIAPTERTYLVVLTDTPNGILASEFPILNDDRASIVADLKPAIQVDQVHEFTVRVQQGEDLHVSLAWTDPPGQLLALDPLINDLDLEVVGPDPANPAVTVVWRPNPGTSSDEAPDPDADDTRVWQGGVTRLGTKACPVTGPAPCAPACPGSDPESRHAQVAAGPFCDFEERDARNTVENVFLPASDVVGGDYTVRVIGWQMGPTPMLDQPVTPDWVGSDGVDIVDSDRQGYALVASGRVAVDRGFVHFDRAFYACGARPVVTLNDRNAPADATVTVSSPLGDQETFTLAGAPLPSTPAFDLVRAGSPTDFTSGDGRVSVLPDQSITATYADAAPAGHTAVACARTGGLGELELVSQAVIGTCADGDGLLERGEVNFVEVTVRNVGSQALEGLSGWLSTSDPEVAILRERAVFLPAPLPPSGTATARFPVLVADTHACPAADIPATLHFRGHSGCTLALALTLDAGCALSGPPVAVPEEVPPTSLRVGKPDAAGVRLTWSPPPAGATDYNVYRGDLALLHATRAYGHHVGGMGGNCLNGSVAEFTDPDDQQQPDAYYYLVTAVAPCGLEGPAGFDFFDRERPEGGGCP